MWCAAARSARQTASIHAGGLSPFLRQQKWGAYSTTSAAQDAHTLPAPHCDARTR